MKHIPNKIYLNVGCDAREVKDFSELSEVTWCADKINDNDIEYQRKPIWHDLMKNPNDLPDNDRLVLIITDGHVITSKYQIPTWIHEGKYVINVIAWMDIPAFK